MLSVVFALSSPDDGTLQKLMQIPTDIYQKLAGIFIICAVVMSIVTIIFLMYTRDEKNVGMMKQSLKKILIAVIVFLILGSIYSYCMMLVKVHQWDSNASISTTVS